MIDLIARSFTEGQCDKPMDVLSFDAAILAKNDLHVPTDGIKRLLANASPCWGNRPWDTTSNQPV